MSKKPKANPDNIAKPLSILRTVVTHTNFTKWQACIYYSPYDETAQILLLLKDKPGNSTERFLNQPIYFFAASSKIEIDFKISRSISSLFNLRNSPEANPVSDGADETYKQSA